jgi:hypothetical protein
MPHAYGRLRDLPDDRDYRLTEHVRLPLATALPARVDLRATGYLSDPILDQGQLGSCTAHAIASAIQYTQRASGLPVFLPARLALYYWERVIEGSTREDAGAELRDGLKVVAGQPGYVDEALWPYDVERFTVAPPAYVVDHARQDHVTKYMRVDVSAAALKQALAAAYPVVVGFDVYESFELDSVAQTGEVPMPARTEAILGGHAVLCVGYDDSTQRFLCRNSWGDGWGAAGYFTMPYGYLGSPKYAQDFWAIEQEIEGGGPPPAPKPDPASLLAELAALVRKGEADVIAWLTRHGL